MQMSKRSQIALYSRRLGFTRLLERMRTRRRIVVLTYHRIGDADANCYDPAVFSATAERFERQVAYLKRNFRILTLDELLESAARPDRVREACFYLTFDDGYVDNYSLAFPILRSQEVQGTFFLPTSFIGTDRIPWWDAIAYIFRNSKQRAIHLDYPFEATYDTRGAHWRDELRRLLKQFKSPRTAQPARFLEQLEGACGVPLPERANLFMSWEQALEMRRAGMEMQSHAHSHEILSKLSPAAQFEELATSKRILEERLGNGCRAICYPVGGPDCFNQDTIEAARRAGYLCGFTYIGGLTTPGHVDLFRIRRLSVEANQTFDRFRFNAAASAVSGRAVSR
jgi:peptidoglycan/xylan/chitin deacetylase (PgdA/CDA1 family)